MISVFKKNFIAQYVVPLFFFLVPWQTRWIINVVKVNGTPSEFGVISIFATQILLLFILLFFGKRQVRKEYKNVVLGGSIFVLAVFFSVFFALDTSIALVGLMNILMAVSLFFVLIDERVNLKIVLIAFILGLILPVLFGVWQVVVGTSPASTLFGFSIHDADRLGEAVTGFFSGRTLRAHGGFSHPNVFGGYLAVSLVSIIFLFKKIKDVKYKILMSVVAFILTVGLFLTFSQSAWLGLVMSLIVGGIVYFFSQYKFSVMIAVIVSAVIISGAFGYMFAVANNSSDSDIKFEERSMVERVQMYDDYVDIMEKQDYIFGNGIRNYVSAFAEKKPGKDWWEYQPIHNVLLLAIGEIGLLGIGAMIFWLYRVDKINFSRFPNTDAIIAFMSGNIILFISFFDHYLWTSWQGIVLVALVLAMTVRFGEEDRQKIKIKK